MTAPLLTLNDGHPLPWIGFGTYPLRGEPAFTSIKAALQNGYRLLDGAVNYRNEVEIGRAAREFLAAGGERDEIVVQTKVPALRHSYDDTTQVCQDSVALLGLERLDVVLLHAPNPMAETYRDGWRALVDLRNQGVVRSIGISNFTIPQLNAIVEDTGVVPAVGQIDMHPYSTLYPMRVEFARLGIVTQSWRPLGGELPVLTAPPVADAAAAHAVTPAQAALRWHLQSGSVPLPMATAVAQQREFMDVFGFELSEDEMAAITALNRPGDGSFAP